MLVLMFSIYDDVTKVFQPPFYAHNNEHAKRIVMSMAKQDGNLSLYPDNFKLYQVGNFDDSKGAGEFVSPPAFVIDVDSLASQAGGE